MRKSRRALVLAPREPLEVFGPRSWGASLRLGEVVRERFAALSAPRYATAS
jgi:hypothetical protein